MFVKTAYSREDIERLAEQAALPLTPQWCDDLVIGSVFVLWAKGHLQALFELQEGRAARPHPAEATGECTPT